LTIEANKNKADYIEYS